jgi:hypothetical protein
LGIPERRTLRRTCAAPIRRWSGAARQPHYLHDLYPMGPRLGNPRRRVAHLRRGADPPSSDARRRRPSRLARPSERQGCAGCRRRSGARSRRGRHRRRVDDDGI